jgi:creatinine amidohydrolase/Fe(II)-dependent formamide hydrolase-like protein
MLGMQGHTTSGVVGRPTNAASQKGTALVDALVELAQSHLTALD